MIAMVKEDRIEYVPDIFIQSYLEEGYAPVEDADKMKYCPDSIEDPGQDADPGEDADSGTDQDAADPFVCPVCGKGYKTEARMAAHVASKHPEN